MIVDVHAHLLTRRYLDAFRRATIAEAGEGAPGLKQIDQLANFPAPFFDDPDQLEARLTAMDDAGVERQVLSLAAMFPYFTDEDRAAETTRIANETMASVVAARPDRFSMFIALPLPHPDAALAEIDRWRGDPIVVGAELGTSVFGRSVAHPSFDPVFGALEQAWGLAFYHPTGNGVGSELVNGSGLEVSVGTSFEDTVLAVQLAIAGIPARFPSLRHIVPHFGGMAALLLERLDNQGSSSRPVLTEPLSATLRRFFYDTVAHGSRPALHAGVEAFGAEQLVPGSDYPIVQLFEPYERTFGWIAESDLAASDRHQILHVNSQRLLSTQRLLNEEKHRHVP